MEPIISKQLNRALLTNNKNQKPHSDIRDTKFTWPHGAPATNTPAANLTTAAKRPMRMRVRQRQVRRASRNDDRGESADRTARTKLASAPLQHSQARRHGVSSRLTMMVPFQGETGTRCDAAAAPATVSDESAPTSHRTMPGRRRQAMTREPGDRPSPSVDVG